MEAFQVLLLSIYLCGFLSYLAGNCTCFRMGESPMEVEYYTPMEVEYYTCEDKILESRKKKKRQFVLIDSETDDHRASKRLKVDKTVNEFRCDSKEVMETNTEELVRSKIKLEHVENHAMDFLNGFRGRIGESALEVEYYTPMEVEYYTCEAMVLESRKKKKRQFILTDSETDDYRASKRLNVDKTVNKFRCDSKKIMETDTEELVRSKIKLEHVENHAMDFLNESRRGECAMEVKYYTCEAKILESILSDSKTDGHRTSKQLKIDETVNGFRCSGKRIIEADIEELVRKKINFEHVGNHAEKTRGINTNLRYVKHWENSMIAITNLPKGLSVDEHLDPHMDMCINDIMVEQSDQRKLHKDESINYITHILKDLSVIDVKAEQRDADKTSSTVKGQNVYAFIVDLRMKNKSGRFLSN